MYLIEYKEQRKHNENCNCNNPYKSMITIKLLPDEFSTICHALYFYGQPKEERHYSYGEKEEIKMLEEIEKLEKQFELISNFTNYGIDEIIAQK